MLFFTVLDEIQAKKPYLIFNFSFLILDGVFGFGIWAKKPSPHGWAKFISLKLCLTCSIFIKEKKNVLSLRCVFQTWP